MKKICKNCKWFGKDGLVSCDKISFERGADMFSNDSDAFYFEVNFFVGDNFGCIHWEGKHENND